MAGFLGRFTGKTDYTDGYPVAPSELIAVFGLYNNALINAAYIKSLWNMTTEQGNELDEVLATRPASNSAWAAWSGKLYSVMSAGFANDGAGWPGFETVAQLRTALGLSNP